LKKHLFLFIFLFFSIFFYACPEALEENPCDVNSDCKKEGTFCDAGYCGSIGYCDRIDCGNGKAVVAPGDEQGCRCKCNEGNVYYKGKCVPICDSYTTKCKAFDNGSYRFNECNMELGHCDKICKGEGSCSEGYFCSDKGKCESVNGYCKNDDDCTANANPFCNTHIGLCEPYKWYCINEMDCIYYEKESGRTYCDQTINKCLLGNGRCEEDDDCRGNVVKTVCNLDDFICEEPSDKTPKEVFIDNYSESSCQKYFECNPDIDYNLYSEAYKTMEECKTGTASELTQMLNSEVCNIYDDSFSSQIITCTDNYVCSSNAEGLDEGFSSCFFEHFMDICNDGNGKNEATKEMGRVYCETMFICDEDNALQRFKDLEDCKIEVANNTYTGFIYDNMCPYFKRDLFSDYISCMDNLTCEQQSSECETEFDKACNEAK